MIACSGVSGHEGAPWARTTGAVSGPHHPSPSPIWHVTGAGHAGPRDFRPASLPSPREPNPPNFLSPSSDAQIALVRPSELLIFYE